MKCKSGHFLAFILVTLGTLGCAQRESYHVETAVTAMSGPKLGSVRQDVHVGEFYLVEGPRLDSILSIRDQMVLGESAGWFQRQTATDGRSYQVGSAEIVHVRDGCPYDGTPGSSCQLSEQRVGIFLRTDEVDIESLKEPIVFLELLNRPLTGAPYNRIVEQRISSWRASLGDILSRTRFNSDRQVGLCTATLRLRRGSLVLDGQGLESATAREIASKFLAQYGINSGRIEGRDSLGGDGGRFEMALTATPYISVELRKVIDPNSSIEPYIDFALGDPIIVGPLR